MENDVGMAIRLARIATGKTQWELARKLGVHVVVVNYLEHGKRDLDLELAQALLRELKAGAPEPRSRVVNLVMDEAESILTKATKEANPARDLPSDRASRARIRKTRPANSH